MKNIVKFQIKKLNDILSERNFIILHNISTEIFPMTVYTSILHQISIVLPCYASDF